MRWAIAAGVLAIVVNGVVLMSGARERAAPATLATIDICRGHLVGGGSSDVPPALRLVLGPDSLSIPAGLDAAGLQALGFPASAVSVVGRVRDAAFRWPRTRPAWVRLRQHRGPLEPLAVVEVAPRREELRPDSGSIIVRGLVSFRLRRSEPSPAPPVGVNRGRVGDNAGSGVIYPAVVELVPFQLHLDHRQIAALERVRADSAGCGVKGQAVIANGANGGIWVASVR
jgi:hypothetical protein